MWNRPFINSNLKENFMWEKYMCRYNSPSALGYFISTEAGIISTLLPTVSQWAWLMVSKWLFVQKVKECFTINWVPGAGQRSERSSPLRWLFISEALQHHLSSSKSCLFIASMKSFLQLNLYPKMKFKLNGKSSASPGLFQPKRTPGKKLLSLAGWTSASGII